MWCIDEWSQPIETMAYIVRKLSHIYCMYFLESIPAPEILLTSGSDLKAKADAAYAAVRLNCFLLAKIVL